MSLISDMIESEILSFLRTQNADLHEIREHLSRIGVHANGKEIEEACDGLYRLGEIKVDSFVCIDLPRAYKYNVILKAAKK